MRAESRTMPHVTMSGSKRRLARTILASGAVLVALAFVEVTLRVAGVHADPIDFRFVGDETSAPDTVPDPELFWRLAPRSGEDPVGPDGLRGDVPAGARGPRELRILCVGDSSTYGWRVAAHECFVSRLDQTLQGRFPNADVRTLLAAVPGYSTHQDRILVDRLGERGHADLTVLYVGAWNDFLPAVGLDDDGYSKEVRRFRESLWLRLRIGRVVRRAWNPVPSLDHLEARARAAAAVGEAIPRRVPLRVFGENVRALVLEARRHGAVIGVRPLRRRAVYDDHEVAKYDQVLDATYADLGVPVLDARATMDARAAAFGQPDGDGFLLDAVHPTVLGHALLAEALAPLAADLLSARVAGIGGSEEASSLVVSEVAPWQVEPGRDARIRLHGRGFKGLGEAPHFEVGTRRLRSVRVVDDATIEIDLPADATSHPGSYPLRLRTRNGAVAARPLEVRPWSPEITIEHSPAGADLVARIATDRPLLLIAWASKARLETPLETPWGPFGLADRRGGAHVAPTVNALGIIGLDLPLSIAHRETTGPSPIEVRIALPPEWTNQRATPVHIQLLVRSGVLPEQAWLSEPSTVSLP